MVGRNTSKADSQDCFSKSITPNEDVVDNADVDTCLRDGNVLSLEQNLKLICNQRTYYA